MLTFLTSQVAWAALPMGAAVVIALALLAASASASLSPCDYVNIQLPDELFNSGYHMQVGCV